MASLGQVREEGRQTLPGHHLGPSAAFVDRETEREVLSHAWARALDGAPQLLMVDGDPGVGKTALVDHFVAGLGDDAVAIIGSGEQGEREVPLATLQHLMPAAAIDHPSGVGPTGVFPEVADPLIAGAELLAILGELQHSGPVVLIVDDSHWCDTASAQALTFAFRRLRHDRVLVILVARTEELSMVAPSLVRLVQERGSRLRLGGLGVEHLKALAETLGVGTLSDPLAAEIHARTGGNPLYATAVLAAQGEPAGAMTLTAPLDSGAPLRLGEEAYALDVVERVNRTTPIARRLIKALAVCGMAAQLSVVSAISGTEDDDPSVDDIANTRVILLHDDARGLRLEFVHPLARSAVYHSIPPSELRAVHAAAADLPTIPLQDRLLHRVASATAPDDALAAELEEFARHEVARLAWGAAAWAMAAASRFSSDRAAGERRSLEAIAHAVSAGDAEAATRLSEGIEGYAQSPWRLAIEGILAALQGDPRRGEQLLQAAWDGIADPASDAVLADLVSGWLSTLVLNDGRASQAIEPAGWLAHRAVIGTPGLVNVASGFGALWLADGGRADLIHAHADDLMEQALAADLDARQAGLIFSRAALRVWADDLDRAWEDLSAVTASLRRRGPFVDLIAALTYTSDAAYRLGRWDDAAAYGSLAASAAEDAEQGFLLPLVHSVASWPRAGRGEWEDAEHHARRAVDAAAMVGDLGSRLWSGMAAARLAHARADMPGVIAAIAPLLSIRHATGLRAPSVQPWEGLYGEALIAAGRLAEAEQMIRQLETDPNLRGKARPHAEALWLRGLVRRGFGDGAAALQAFRGAVEIVGRASHRFLEARLRVTYGEALLGAGQRREALAQLEQARHTYEHLHARPYAERLALILVGAGIPSDGPGTLRATLTEREAAVATLAAQGLTNREIARELMLSAKTVEYHLSKLYTKLNVRSRTALARVLLNPER
ncbi:MAG TPA: LuxR C-terminal-related transcriptional regulator [Mycobacteriales bacterium]|nr:LuxR C-terminal-related transcriptional regulator [Mycobacteriales bacterium]HWC34159.1 LuxR C-terminal-related transcriptional regulator [Mycobacteriales bacterium]